MVKKKIKTWSPLFMDGIQLPQVLQSHCKGAVYFLTLTSLKFLALIWSTSEGWKAGLTLESPSYFENGTPKLGVQHVNHSAIAPWKSNKLERKNTQLPRPFQKPFFPDVRRTYNINDIRKLTFSCWKISNKKRLAILEYFDAYICHHNQSFMLYFSLSTWYLTRAKFYVPFSNKLIDNLSEYEKFRKEIQNIPFQAIPEAHYKDSFPKKCQWGFKFIYF